MDNYVADGSLVKCFPMGRAFSKADFSQYDALVEVDSVVCNITVNREQERASLRNMGGLLTTETKRQKSLLIL